ncbi:hypothetical protein CKO38_01905 [Rhodospirillum rubrum]|uniref:helix-turn-helix domain-containing protein n=1 Tax=Rhodospirillum rubrum TaxID=1085 RepID=UPI001906E978|nr:helix-turn-helix domain-containing protein [Rhodospirillum rubrum]MBK1663990.1 hypothetical protein [Rhodospirillum rubrum]MBK1675452.1 hypothetical protein [Rhodospirillum rubrum]
MSHETCPVCGGVVTVSRVDVYEDDLLGIPVTLRNAVERRRCAGCGEESVSYPNLDGLIAAVAMARALYPLELSGDDLRFLRKALGLSAKDFAEKLELDPASLSRWENNKQALGGFAEKVIRMFVCGEIDREGRAPAITYTSDRVPTMMIVKAGALPPFHPILDQVKLKDGCRNITTLQWDQTLAA